MDTKAAHARLEEEKGKLEKELQSLGRLNSTVSGEWGEPRWELAPSEGSTEPDILDQAELVTEREGNAAIFADLEARYANVAEALSRLKAGSYGLCEVCRKPIEPARLAADPAATTCTEHR